MKLYLLLLVAFCGGDRVKVFQQRRDKFFGKFWKTEGRCWMKLTDTGKPYYGTCYQKTKPVAGRNCYLYSDYWSLPASDINLVFIDLYGEGTICSKVKYYCEDKYLLRAYTSSGINDAITEKVIDPSPFKNISLIPNHTKQIGTTNFYNYKETIPVNVFGRTLLRLLFHASFFCGGIYGISVYYYTCPVRTKELVIFLPRKAPSMESSPLKVVGKCAENSIAMSKKEIFMDCSYNGSYTVYGKCYCDKGYEFQVDNTCTECDVGKFKPNVGNGKCKPCGKNSVESQGSTSCVCKEKFFRIIGKETVSEAVCYRPPSAPRVKDIRNKTEHSAIVELYRLTGTQIGDGPIGKYVLNCTRNCPLKNKFPLISQSTIFHITGLGSYVTYHFIVYNSNNITELTGHFNPTKFNFTTLSGGVPGQITGFNSRWNDDGSITLRWKGPKVRGGKRLEYVVEYDDIQRVTKSTSITIKSTSSTKKYIFTIYARYMDGKKLVKGKVYVSKEIKVKGGVPLLTTIIVVVAIIVVIILISITSLCIYRRRNPPLAERREDGTVIQPSMFLPGSKVYVDPTIYKDVDDAVGQFAYELNRSQLTFGGLIGGGEFAQVYTGTLLKSNGKTANVAIKMLKRGACKKDRDDFLSEAAILGQFIDPNVIAIEGVVTKDHPHLIVLENMANGSLDTYLQKNDMQFSVVELLGMARCVASGMTYLSNMGFIHRDLAARNVLVDEHNICKITDFGMSRELKLDDTYETQGVGKIPVRWTAPEAIQYKKFTSASDCWSFGILLWEIMSYGERPYWDWNNSSVLERLYDGYRLPPPMNCRKVIHNLMLDCWNKDRGKRPKFKEIREKIEQWIRSPELLAEIASVVTKTDENLDYTVLETVQKWLEAIGMEQYTDMFLDNQLTSPKLLLDVDDNDLVTIGINPIGHRKKILKAVRNTRDQTSYLSLTTCNT